MNDATLFGWGYLYFFFFMLDFSPSNPLEMVTNTNDSGGGSLRQAIISVDQGGTILFSPDLNGDTIVLTSSALVINKHVSIIGPGSKLLAITSNRRFRLIKQLANTTLMLNGMHLTGGKIKDGTFDIFSKGGGIYSEGTLLLENCKVSNCSATYGGAIFADSITINNCNITDNTSVLHGGGINAKFTNATNSTIAKNISTGRIETIRLGLIPHLGNGGGLFNRGTTCIIQCTISNNKCGLRGGGIYSYSPIANLELSVSNSTVIDNSAYIGGGIYEELTKIFDFSNNIIASNDAIQNAPDFFNGGTWVTTSRVNNNIIGILDDLQVFPGQNNQLGNIQEPLLPLLDTLKDNGGLTLTRAVLECSPVIDAGLNLGLSNFDQKGYDRIVGNSIDVGPVEYEDPYGQLCYYDNYKNYTLLAYNQVDLKNKNSLINGGAGVINPLGKAIIKDKSKIVGVTTFVKAANIEISSNSLVSNPIYEPPLLALPTFISNNQEGVNDLKIKKNQVTTVSDSVFKDITIEDGAIVTFTSEQIYCTDFSVKDGAQLTFSYCTEIFIDDLLDIEKNNRINTANKGLNMYAEHAHIDEGNEIIANMYTSTHIRVSGKIDRPSFLKGLFVGDDIEGNNHVYWDWNKDDPCGSFQFSTDPVNTSCDDLVVDAGLDKAVLRSKRFSIFNRYACVLLNANVNGGNGPYSYDWSPSEGLSDPNALRPQACPTESTTYILRVEDANGCISRDTTTIQAYTYDDIIGAYSCENNPFKIQVCDLETNETKCVSIFSNSEKNGLGPNLNRGNPIGSCDPIITYPYPAKKALYNVESGSVWPNPSKGTVHISYSSATTKEIDIVLYDAAGKTHHVRPVKSYDKHKKEHTFTFQMLNSGIYFFRILSDAYMLNSGKFLIIN